MAAHRTPRPVPLHAAGHPAAPAPSTRSCPPTPRRSGRSPTRTGGPRPVPGAGSSSPSPAPGPARSARHHRRGGPPARPGPRRAAAGRPGRHGRPGGGRTAGRHLGPLRLPRVRRPRRPSQGGLRLYDATLTIPEISGLRLADAELAYLSACSTAHRGGGTRTSPSTWPRPSNWRVSGTSSRPCGRWTTRSPPPPPAASTGAPAGPAAVGVARALRRVTHDLRAAYPTRPDLWAPLIHSGP
ncbi:CHAT domain-containing protein [Streptomyces sp. M19]